VRSLFIPFDGHYILPASASPGAEHQL